MWQTIWEVFLSWTFYNSRHHRERLIFVIFFATLKTNLLRNDWIHINRFRNTCWVYLTSLSICLSFYIKFLPSIRPSVLFRTQLHVFQSVHLSFYMTVHISTFLSLCLPTHLSVYSLDCSPFIFQTVVCL